VADELPYVTGTLGLAGTKPSQDMLQECDLLLLVGTTFPYPEFLPRPGAAILISINLIPTSPGPARPVDIDLVGDAATTLDALLPYLKAGPPSDWSERIEALTSAWWRTVEQEASSASRLVHPGLAISTLSAIAPENCTIAVDIGTVVQWFARSFQLRGKMRTSLSGGLASMGASIPYAIAAKFAVPSRPAIALLGDGAMQMNGLNELITVAESWMEWSSPQFVVLVLNNSALNQVTWERRLDQSQAHGRATHEIANIPYHLFANMLGLRGLLVTRPEGLARAFRDAFAADRPVLIEVRTDPAVCPLPPHILADRARELARSMAGFAS
jgi:pyruvate dehydrogenase (quinone)